MGGWVDGGRRLLCAPDFVYACFVVITILHVCRVCISVGAPSARVV